MAALQQRLSSLVLGLSLVLLSGCHFTERAPHDSATDARPIVLTTFTVLPDMARQVAGDRLQVCSIVKPGAEIHAYEPTPSDLERASNADLVGVGTLGRSVHQCCW